MNNLKYLILFILFSNILSRFPLYQVLFPDGLSKSLFVYALIFRFSVRNHIKSHLYTL